MYEFLDNIKWHNEQNSVRSFVFLFLYIYEYIDFITI